MIVIPRGGDAREPPRAVVARRPGLGAAIGRDGAPEGPRCHRGAVGRAAGRATLADGAAEPHAPGRHLVLPEHRADGRRQRRDYWIAAERVTPSPTAAMSASA
jgi:hypothetical protein